MANNKQSTKAEEELTVDPKRDYYLPSYGITVQASSAEEAEEVARKRTKQEQDK